MRRYYGGDHRVLRDGSIEIDGTWAGVQLIALGLAGVLLLLLLLHNRLLLFPAVACALYLLVLPTRRRVTFDASARVLRVQHAGPFHERWSRAIPFAEVHAVKLAAAGRRGGRPVRAAIALTGKGDVYLITLVESRNLALLKASVASLLSLAGAPSDR
jgi:hypothetical protein